MSVGATTAASSAPTKSVPSKVGDTFKGNNFRDKDKPQSVRSSNIVAAKAVADAVCFLVGN
jgi:hypothetical protein